MPQSLVLARDKMAPKPPKKAKGSGHSYVNKDKGAAKAQSNKRTVATWLWGEPDADLSSALSQLAPLQLWKEFAATLGRSAPLRCRRVACQRVCMSGQLHVRLRLLIPAQD